MEFTLSEDCDRCGAMLNVTMRVDEEAEFVYTACPGCRWLTEYAIDNDEDDGTTYLTGEVIYDPRRRRRTTRTVR